MKSKFLFFNNELDITFAIVGIILSLILIIYTVVEISRFVYVLTGIMTLISCILWLKIRKICLFEFKSYESPKWALFWAISFFILYTFGILTLSFRQTIYERPIIFFIIIAMMAATIACEIISSNRRNIGFFLIQVLILGLMIAWSQLLIFPSLLGIDPWYHFALTNEILNQSHLPINYVYSKLPLFHIIISETSLITDFPYKFSTMISVSLGQILCNVIFIYLISNKLFNDHRIGLLAALMMVISNLHINMSFWSIPNSFAVIFIPIVIYLLLFKTDEKKRLNFISITIIILITIILTHTITALCMAILLFAIWVVLHFKGKSVHMLKKPVPLSLFIGFSVAMFAWWSYASGNIFTLTKFIDAGFEVEELTQNPQLIVQTIIPIGEQIFNYLGMILFFAISFIGIFYMISKKGTIFSFIIACIGIIPLAIGFFSLITGLYVMVNRWWFISQVLLSIPLAVSLILISTCKFKRIISIYCFIFGLIVILSFLAISYPLANVDNHFFSPNTGITYAYSESELLASEFFAENSIGIISSDFHYCVNPSSSIFIHLFSMNPTRLRILDYSLASGEYDHDGSIKIIRSKKLTEPLSSEGVKAYPDTLNRVSNLGFNKIFSTPSIEGYIG